MVPLHSWQIAALKNPFTHFAMLAGISSGKTFTAAHFVIHHILEKPTLTGFIGANSWDQLSGATLRETMYWLEYYGFQFVIDKIPPESWGKRREFKTYHNIMTVRNPWTSAVTTIFVRVLSNPNAPRGLEFSWYVFDESRDTKKEAHDVILSRLRESDYIKGLVVTTTNGQDWVYDRFVKGLRPLYGSEHVETYEAVKAKIITEEFYNGLLASYSPLMAEQELFARHVNVNSGRAYYAASEKNRRAAAPWGPTYPDTDYPLVVGMDFNFSPSPCVWTISQRSPEEDRMHVFGEISAVETGTKQMTERLIQEYPGFFYQIFGDASGNRGTTSNAGEHDYNQVASVLQDAELPYSIDVDQANPRVRDRVECVNALYKNMLGEIRLTYNPARCPLLDLDNNIVGWKKTVISWQGKLDNAGNPNATHSSDGLGYAVFKLFPPGRRGGLIPSNPSLVSQALGHVI